MVDFVNKSIAELFPVPGRIGPMKGEVGIEVEVEGFALPKVIRSYWSVHSDGSLRGESAEYVLKKPIVRKNIVPYLKYLRTKLNGEKTKINDSPRTSVHIHLNQSTRNMTTVFNEIVLYLIFENMLVEYAGSSRVGNLFCLRACDAEGMIDLLVRTAETRRFNPNDNGYRYSSLNVCALRKFNSLEYRALRGTTDAKVIGEWAALLLAVHDAADKYGNPKEIIQDFCKIGDRAFLKRIFPKHHRMFNRDQTYADMWDGVRRVQEIAYATDWATNMKNDRVFSQHLDREE